MSSQKSTGIFRIVLVLGGLWLLGSMISTKVQASQETILPSLSAAFTTLQPYPDFTHTTVHNGEITLHYPDGTVEVLEAAGSLAVMGDGVSYAWKTGGDVFFVISGEGEAVKGYVLSADASVSMAGVQRLEIVQEPVSGAQTFSFSGRK